MKSSVVLDRTNSGTTLEGLMPRLPAILAVVGGLALAVAIGLGWSQGDGGRYFLHAYLTSFCFFLSLTLGAVFFVAAMYATRAGWGVSVRRLSEIAGANVLVLALMFLPLLAPMLLGNSGLYPWVDSAWMADSPSLAAKTPYLNVPFFAVRAVGYFLFWWFIGQFFLRRSTEQDTQDNPELTIRMERWSGPALLGLGVTATFASFDWLMSLTPSWYSTIFGLYFYSGGVVGAFCLLILAAMGLQAAGRLKDAITVEHYHDLGKLLFSGVVFWGYMAFSQYLLIWYANIPEETEWYKDRLSGPWGVAALVILFGNLLIPFFGLLSRSAKRTKAVLAFWAVWLLVVHWIDLYWLVMPSLGYERLPLGLTDLCLFVGLGSFYVAGLWRLAVGRQLVPVGDPRLAESLAFENL